MCYVQVDRLPDPLRPVAAGIAMARTSWMPPWLTPAAALGLLALVTVQALWHRPARRRPANDTAGGVQGRDEDYTAQAEALFERFAERHGLTFRVNTDVPMELCWTFPEQPKLSLPITLGLQNGDELNFGVSDFWSYFFPFDLVAERFEGILDAWVAGDARVAIMHGPGRLLQVRHGEQWKSAYGANGCLFPFRRWPRGFVRNCPEGWSEAEKAAAPT